jgi:CRP/FNR family transcriptional regulator, cyclic AMP receptor protein
MFCNFAPEALAEFDSLGLPVTFEPGDQVYAEGSLVESVYVLCTGRVKLSAVSQQGKTLILKIALPGDVLGLAAAISSQRHEVTAEAIGPVEVKAVAKAEFVRFLAKHGEASLHAAQALSQECLTSFYDVRRLALSSSMAGRLAGMLLEWARVPARGEVSMRFTMALTHEELASLIGTSRETVTRLISRFKRENLIQVHGATMHILAPEKLEKLAV